MLPLVSKLAKAGRHVAGLVGLRVFWMKSLLSSALQVVSEMSCGWSLCVAHSPQNKQIHNCQVDQVENNSVPPFHFPVTNGIKL